MFCPKEIHDGLELHSSDGDAIPYYSYDKQCILGMCEKCGPRRRLEQLKKCSAWGQFDKYIQVAVWTKEDCQFNQFVRAVEHRQVNNIVFDIFER